MEFNGLNGDNCLSYFHFVFSNLWVTPEKNLTHNKQNVKEFLVLSRDFYKKNEECSSVQAF